MRELFCLLLGVAALAAGCASREKTGIVRGIYANPGPAVDNRIWAAFGSGYEFDAAVKHGGKVSIRCVNETDKEAHGASQHIRFDQDKPRPIVVAGWARLEGVSGPADYHCSVYLDLALKGGKAWPMKIAAFDPAKEGWQYAEQIHTPPAPIESARVHVFLRERKGTAWFDDIYVGEILDEQGARGKNLLESPGFESDMPGDLSLRDEFFGKLKELNCDAFHLYRSVRWEQVMGADEIPPPDPKDPFLDFVQDAHRRGFKVWLTAGLGLPRIENAKSPEFPFWPCVNNRWGEAYTRALVYFARYGVDGIGVVPDEWNYDNSAVHRFAEHPDPDVAAFYKGIRSYCACDVCRSRFKERTGLEYPDTRNAWKTPDAVWAQFTRFRYDSTAAWIRRSIEAVKKINPRIVTDTMICVLPVCSDNRLHTGAAWDQIGVETGLDCLQTDPYIQLHNYLGDSTHYYTTETALHLAAANWKGGSGVTLESCKLREDQREKEAAEVYGSALSCLARGSREFFWWHFNYVSGKAKWLDPKPPADRVAAAYKVMQEMERDLAGANVPGDLLVLYSRASEDTWDWLANAQAASAEPSGGRAASDTAKPNRKRGFIAHRNVLYWLLRRGYSFRMTFLDNPDPARLKEAKTVIVPFPYSLKESEVAAIQRLAAAGKSVILMSELSPVDEMGRSLPQPRLAGLTARSNVRFLGDDFAVGLLEETPPVKGPKAVVPLPPFDKARAADLEKLLSQCASRPASLFAEQPAQDVEAALLRGPRGPVLLLINWDLAQPARIRLRPVLPGTCKAAGWAILGDASVNKVELNLSGDPWLLELAPQEARLLKLN